MEHAEGSQVPDVVTETHSGGSLEELHRERIRVWSFCGIGYGHWVCGSEGNGLGFDEVRQLVNHRVVMQVREIGGRGGRPAWMADNAPNRFRIRDWQAISGLMNG